MDKFYIFALTVVFLGLVLAFLAYMNNNKTISMDEIEKAKEMVG